MAHQRHEGVVVGHIPEHLSDYRESVRPKPGCGVEEYALIVTGQLETSRGVAWTGDLMRNGVKVGSVENRGDGGATEVFLAAADQRAELNAVLAAAYGESDADEDFIAHLDFLIAEGQGVHQ
jgi:hypothetical protein